MMMLGIVLHGSQFYMAEPPASLPLRTDPSTSYFFDLILHFIHSFRMPLFFVLAGFFPSLLVGKRDFRRTYINRAKRILLPLLAAAVTILPLTGLFLISFLTSARFGTHHLIPDPGQVLTLMDEIAAAGFPVGEPSLRHLWFLYYLLYFYLTIPLCFLLSRWSLKLKLEKFIVSPAMFVALTLGTIATLWSFRGGVVFEGFIFIKPYLPSLFYYGSFFVIGYLFHSHRVILQSFARFLPWTTALSLLLFPAAVYLTNLDLASEATGEFHLYSVTANAFLTWSLIYMFMGLFCASLTTVPPGHCMSPTRRTGSI